MALVYVIMIVAILTVVTVTILQAADQDIRFTKQDEDTSQAYYYAKSGVEIAVGYILKTLDNTAPAEPETITYYGKLGKASFSTSIPVDDKGREDYNIKFTITIVPGVGEDAEGKKNKTTYIIQSTGYSGGMSENGSSASGATATAMRFEIDYEELKRSVEGGQGSDVGANIPPVVADDFTTNYALFTKELIDLDSGSPTIIGDVGTNSGPVRLNYSSRIYDSDNGYGTIYLGPGAEVIYPQWRTRDWIEEEFEPDLEFPAFPVMPPAPEAPGFPEVPDSSGIGFSDDVTSGKRITLAPGSITKYKKVSLGWNDVLTFDMQGDATVIIEKFESSGEIRLSGQGKLTMVIRDDIDGSRTLINKDGDPTRLTLIAEGSKINLKSGGNGSSVSATVFAPNADISASNTNINGDLIIGGDSLEFSGVSHNGALYALNNNAEIEYNGNRSLVQGTYTKIYSNGKKLTISPAHLQGEVYLTHAKAQVNLGSSTTFRGNILTFGNSVTVSGAASLAGHIVAPNPDAEIRFTGGSDHEGAVITAGKKLSFSGGSVAMKGLLFAPEAEFSLTGGARIYGSIMSKSFIADGGSYLAFEEISCANLPVFIEPTEIKNAESNWRAKGRWTAN